MMKVNTNRLRSTILTTLLCLLAGSPGAASLPEAPAARELPTAAQDSSERTYRAQRIEAGPPDIDGRLDERAWREASFTSGLVQQDPNEGEPATQATRVAIRYDRQNLYFAARMERERPEALRRQVTRRDEAGTSAALYVHLDPERDRRTAKVFGVTSAGVRVDYFLASDRTGPRDHTFDPIWDAAVHVDSTGWTVEARIPFSELRLSGSPRSAWGLQVQREIPSRNEVDQWVLVPKTREGWVSHFGTLTGLSDIDRSRPVEARPYAALRGDVRGSVPARDPLRSDARAEARLGGELTAGIGSGLTLDATVNPDFGQVEADPARVNLSAYETFFREHRPFFTEGSQFLTGGGPDYFYSRRIGAPPHGRPSGQFVKSPDNTTILGAGKLTGRVDGDLSVGVLGALTQEESARIADAPDGDVRSRTVEPATGFGVARVEEQLAGGSTVGLSLTGVQRDLDEGGPLAGQLPETSVAGGADWSLRFGDGRYALSGHGGLSHVAGSRDAILGLQRSSVRYFQRPEADHVAVDSSRTSLTGWTGGLELRKRSGEHWLWNVEATASSPGFAINDLGRLRSTDELAARAGLTYRETDPGPLFRGWSASFDTRTEWNFGGTRRYTNLFQSVQAEWPNFMRTRLRFSYLAGGVDDTRTRGGPVVDRTDSWGLLVRHATNPREVDQYDATAFYGRGEPGTWFAAASLGASVRPSPDLRLEFSPQVSVREEARQYVTTLPDGPAATYGERYVFAGLDRTTLSAELRADYAFTPDLSLEVFAQPFAASGDYEDFGELRRPGDRALLRYGEGGSRIVERGDRSRTVAVDGQRFTIPEPDFNVFSFRSTAVLRWQWRPGSTFYLAWQQNRSKRVGVGSSVGPGGWLEPFDVAGDQALTAKMSYWLRL